MTTMIKALPLFIFLSLSQIASAQTTDQALTAALHSLRNELFLNNKEQIFAYKGMLERLDASGVSKDKQYEFILNIFYAYSIYQYPSGLIQWGMEEDYPMIAPYYETNDLEIIKSNATLSDLISEKLLKQTYPFPLNEQAPLFAELREYGLKEGMKIGEIGAGTGLVSLLIGSIYDSLEIHVNELAPELMQYIKASAVEFPTLRKSNKLYIVSGQEKEVNFENKNLDLIFMRDSFHHFNKKKAMITSISQSLSSEGLVVVVEEVSDFSKPPYSCKQVMKRADILKAFEAGGFTCVGELGNGSEYIFKFRKK